MKNYKHYIVLILCLFVGLSSYAQFNPDKICRIEDGKVIFTINLKWSEKEKKELSSLFDLDSALVVRVFKGETKIVTTGENWSVKKIKPNLVELSKPMDSKMNKSSKTDGVFFVLDQWINFNGKSSDENITFGVNDFEIPNTFVYENNNAWIYLSGHQKAGKVYLSGSFNNWSTTQNPMKSNGSGWTINLNLKPGRYTYKYIVDGKWISDPYNKQREKDGSGGYNSILFCCNHSFYLAGHQNAKSVAVTGNFYNWRQQGLKMKKTAGGWSLPVYLRDGLYAYKFLVDRQWITDPSNPDIRKDSGGNENSFLGIGESYLFKLDGYKEAQSVFLAGSFNGWNDGELRMTKTENGWQLPYFISAGNYEYKFIVDGRWMKDPANPFSSGSGDRENSFIALKANHIFELKQFPDAKKVVVTGSFTGWNRNGYKMVKIKDKWILPMYLKPGKYTYKFIVDNQWILDPANTLYEQNEYNTNNSVLWIEP